MIRWPYILAALLYMGIIFWFSSQPGDKVGIPAPWDKVVHTAVYGFLGWLLQRGLNRPVLAWVIAIGFGISDEFHQRFTPGRYFDLTDWLADSVGSAIGVWLSRR